MRNFRMFAVLLLLILFVLVGQVSAQNAAGKRISHATCEEVLVVMPQAPAGLEGTTVTLHVVGPNGSTDIVLSFQGYNGPTAKWAGSAPNLGNGTYTFSGVDNELTAELNCWQDPGDDDDDETPPPPPTEEPTPEPTEPPGDDDETPPPPDDDDDEMCPYDETLPIDSDLCVPPVTETPPADPDDDDDVTPTPGPPGPKCLCDTSTGHYACYSRGTEPTGPDITGWYDANGNGKEDPGESVTAGTCFGPAPTPPAEVETGLFDEEELSSDNGRLLVLAAVVVVVSLVAFLLLRPRAQ